MNIVQTVQKWGNSTGVRLPKQIMEAVDLSANQQVEVTVKKGSIIITPFQKERSVSLQSMLKGVSPELVGGETQWGSDQGNEIYE